MRDTRPVVVGMNNPLSASPRAALLPHPRGSAGWNLWRMARDVCGVSRAEFRRSMEFVNLCDDRIWCPIAARRKYEALETAWAGRRVLLLGRAVLGVLRLDSAAGAALWRSERGYLWCWLPHPSGLCRDYNDPLVRRIAGLRLEQMINQTEEQT